MKGIVWGSSGMGQQPKRGGRWFYRSRFLGLRITMDLDHALDKLQLPFRVEKEKSVVWKSGTRLC